MVPGSKFWDVQREIPKPKEEKFLLQISGEFETLRLQKRPNLVEKKQIQEDRNWNLRQILTKREVDLENLG